MRIHRSLEDIPEINNAVITIGSFDGVHMGHQKLISRIIQLSHEIEGESVIITFEPHPRSIIYPRDQTLKLINTQKEKVELMEQFGVDHLVIVPFTVEFSQQLPREYIEKFLLKYFQPKFLVIGYDHRFGLNRDGNFSLLKEYEESHDFQLIKIDKQVIEEITISSTRIREAVLSSEMFTAFKFLKYHYKLSGTVSQGEQIGKQIGFPTANIEVDEKLKLIPPDGIYAVFVNFEGQNLEGMLYIGNRPTIGGKREQRIEVHIFDFNELIYGEYLSLELVAYVRDDQRFNNLQELKLQLIEDEQQSKYILSEFKRRRDYKESKVSVVILNYNGQDYLESYLPPVLYSCSDPIDVIVADNNSEDESREYIRDWHPEINLIPFTKNYGFAEGYNRVLKQIKSKYTVILNNDVLVSEAWLDPIIKHMEDHDDVAACQPKIRSLLETEKFEHAGAAGGFIDKLAYAYCRGRIFSDVENDEGQYDVNDEIFWSSGAAMVVRTDVFNNLGGFDKNYFAHYEEIDLCWRLKRAGYKVMAINSSVVYHLGGGTLPYQSSKKIYLNFRNSLLTLLKNDESNMRGFRFISRLFLDAFAALLFFFKGQWNAIGAIIKAHWYIILRLRSVRRTRIKYRRLVEKHRIGNSNLKGQTKSIIPIRYYIFSKKKYSELHP